MIANVKKYDLFFIFLCLLLLVIFSCTGVSSRNKLSGKKIKELVLYNTLSESLHSDINDLSRFKKRLFSDSATLNLLGSVVRVPGSYIWKGFIMGVIRYENGDSTKIRISRYGGFFSSFSDNKFYSFSDKATNYKFQDLVDNFIHETIKW